MSDDLFAWAEQRSCRPPAPPVQPICMASAPQAPTDLPDGYREIVAVLRHHRGAESAITAPQIAQTAGLWPDLSPVNRGTKVRKVLELTQDFWPFPICGDSDGYYVAATADELTHYCANLRSRALCILRRFASSRRAGRRAGFTYHGRGRWSGDSHAPAA
jgi:hypothetical protein